MVVNEWRLRRYLAVYDRRAAGGLVPVLVGLQ
jgi:hypothetical protein